MPVKRYDFDCYAFYDSARLGVQECDDGDYVLYSDYTALREAAKGLIAIHRRHKDLIVYSEQDYTDIWRERVDALAALVGEE